MRLQWAPDAKYWRMLWSVRFALLSAVFGGLWTAIPAFQWYMPPVVFGALSVFFALGYVGFRLVDQQNVPTS